MTLLDRYKGALLGLATGDALGTTLEFTRRESVTPIDDMVGGGPFNLEPGQWTDDTSMALCLAESLIQQNGFDVRDQMERYVRWMREGQWSSTGRCFDIGNTVMGALLKFERTRQPTAGSTEPDTAGNGSLMRLAPVPLRFAKGPAEAVRLAADSSRTTHGAAEAVDACRYFAGLLVGALHGCDKAELLRENYAPRGVDWADNPLSSQIARIASGSFKQKSRSEIRASGYVIHTLEAALWAFHHSSDFREGALLAVNLGEDADTTGAVFGQLAGAYYGVDAIPLKWRELLARRTEIARLASRLFDHATAPRGSRKHVLDLVSRDPSTALNRLVAPLNAHVPLGAVIRPDSHEQSAEFELRDFCKLSRWPGCDLTALDGWWVDSAFKGPTWDLLAECLVDGRPGMLLVEAKAHVGELERTRRRPSASTSEQARENTRRIDASLESAERWIRTNVSSHVTISSSSHYQLANRLSAAVALAECGVHVILIFLGFTGDAYFADQIVDDEHWQREIQDYIAGSLPPDALGKRFGGTQGSVTVVAKTLPVIEVSGTL